MNKRNKRGVRYWLNLWKSIAEEGTLVHKEIEDYIKEGKVPHNPHHKTFLAAEWLDSNDLLASGNVEPEKIVYSEEMGLAGTIDLFVEKDGVVTLVDYKTNKAIKTKGYKDEKCKEPIEDLDDCSYNKYLLQLSTYGHILEEEYGYKVKDLIILHLQEDKAVEIHVEYRKDLVEKMLEKVRENGKKESDKEN